MAALFTVTFFVMPIIIFFTRNIFALTALGSIYWALVWTIIICIVLWVITYQKLAKLLFVASSSFLTALLSVFFYYHNYSQTNYDGTYYVWDVTITERVKQWRYVITTDDNYNFFFQTDTPLDLGQKLFVSSRVQPPSINTSLRRWPVWSQIIKVITEWNEFDYDKRQVMKWSHGTMYSPSFTQTSSNKYTLVSKFRYILTEKVLSIRDDDTAALVLGMLIGDKSLFDKTTYQAYIDSSLVHIVAVSWGNIALLLIFLRIILFWVPFYPRVIILWVSITWYAILCWADASVVRATIMALVTLLALFAGRIVSIRRILSYARIVMLIRNPMYLVYDLGFILSFSALVWIILVTQAWQTSNETDVSFWENNTLDEVLTEMSLWTTKKESLVKNWFYSFFVQTKVDKIDKRWTRENLVSKYRRYVKINALMPTVGATLWVLPIILFFIGITNIMGLLANMVIIPLVPVVMLGWLLVLVTGELLHVLGVFELIAIPAFIIERSANLIEIIAFKSSEYGIYLVNKWAIYTFVLLVLAIIGLCIYFFEKNKPDYVSGLNTPWSNG